MVSNPKTRLKTNSLLAQSLNNKSLKKLAVKNISIKNKPIKSMPLKKVAGFTLVEVIIGIVVLSIALTIISSLIVPTEEKSADNILQIKAAELGQSLLNDISSRAFDHNSDMAGGRVRCGEFSVSCTTTLGYESAAGEVENDSSTYNDVDDFNGYNVIENAMGLGLDSSYSSFIVDVKVIYAGADLGLASLVECQTPIQPNCKLAKRITVSITTPLGTEMKFATHKTNF